MDLEDVTDPSDFSTDSLQKLDSSLRCAICKDFYDAPVILHCGHTFCSLCIRSVLPHKPECPVCRKAAKESHLIRNSSFDEAVNAWSTARELVLKSFKESVKLLTVPSVDSYRPNKRKISHTSHPDPGQDAGPSGLSRENDHICKDSQEDKERLRKVCRRSTADDVTPSSDLEEQELSNVAQTNPTVGCPLCSRKVPYNLINAHLDGGCQQYLAGGSDGDPTVSGSTKPDSKAAWGSIFKDRGRKTTGVSSTRGLVPMTRIAKVSYGVLTLGALRRLLSDKGLPTNGDKDELITRHERWIAIFNANLDRVQPKAVDELRYRLNELEEVAKRPGPKRVDDDKAWTRKNRAQFTSLIETARRKAKPTGNALLLDIASPTVEPLPSFVGKGKNTSSDVIVID